MRYRIFLLTFCSVTLNVTSWAQTVGGNAAFSFISQPNTAQLASLGGINISQQTNDLGMAYQSPALLRKSMSHQISTSFNSFLAGINNYNVATAFYLPKIDLTVGGGLQYLNYGSITQTNAAGNILGTFKPNDFAVQIMAAKQYKERFWLGTTVKFLQSNYGAYRSSGIAMDIGLLYADTNKLMQMGVLIKNIGTQLSTYSPGIPKEELPFDVQAGISKRLANAPIQFSLTAHNLHRLNIFYEDTAFNTAEGDLRKVSGLQKVFAHLIFSTQVYLSDKAEISIGYNFLRRQDLLVFNTTNGLNGLTAGVGFLLKKLHIRYATGFYQRNTFHQFSLNFNLIGAPLNN